VGSGWSRQTCQLHTHHAKRQEAQSPSPSEYAIGCGPIPNFWTCVITDCTEVSSGLVGYGWSFGHLSKSTLDQYTQTGAAPSRYTRDCRRDAITHEVYRISTRRMQTAAVAVTAWAAFHRQLRCRRGQYCVPRVVRKSVCFNITRALIRRKINGKILIIKFTRRSNMARDTTRSQQPDSSRAD